MKYSLPILTIAFSFSCSNKNDLTAQLLNEKKVLSDSVVRAQNKQQYYFEKSFTERSKGTDSLVWSALHDTSTIYLGQVIDIQKRLKAIEFSLDSLSRMK